MRTLILFAFGLSGCSFSGEIDPNIECSSSCEEERDECYKVCDEECVDATGDGDEACDEDCHPQCDEGEEECSLSCESAD